MLKEFQHIDALFKWIRTITLLVVTVYLVWCYCLIRQIDQPVAGNKPDYSVTAGHENIPAEPVIAIQPLHQ